MEFSVGFPWNRAIHREGWDLIETESTEDQLAVSDFTMCEVRYRISPCPSQEHNDLEFLILNEKTEFSHLPTFLTVSSFELHLDGSPVLCSRFDIRTHGEVWLNLGHKVFSSGSELRPAVQLPIEFISALNADLPFSRDMKPSSLKCITHLSSLPSEIVTVDTESVQQELYRIASGFFGPGLSRILFAALEALPANVTDRVGLPPSPIVNDDIDGAVAVCEVFDANDTPSYVPFALILGSHFFDENDNDDDDSASLRERLVKTIADVRNRCFGPDAAPLHAYIDGGSDEIQLGLEDDEHGTTVVEARAKFCYLLAVKLLESGPFNAGGPNLMHVGPKRETPRTPFAKSGVRPTWTNGLMAGEWLSRCAENDFASVSEWLSSSNYLSTGYSLRRISSRIVPNDICEELFADIRDANLAIETFRKKLERLEMDTEVLVYDEQTGTTMRLENVGEGITQVIPVLASLVSSLRFSFFDPHLVMVEQPELHLHPAMAARLGDLFVVCSAEAQHVITEDDERNEDEVCINNGHAIIAETHSEHLILRILRRIRQTSDGELPEHIPPIRPDNVSVLWVDNLGRGTTVQRLRIDEQGEFIDRWPQGFFSERAEELY